MNTSSHSLRSVPLVVALLAQTLAVGAATFNSDTLISAQDTNFDGQGIIVTNCTLTVDGSHAFDSLRLLKGGVLTHSALTNGPVTNLLSVVGEQHTLTSTNPAALNQTNVLANTIVVTDLGSSVTYTQGVDYTVLTTAGITSLSLPPGSAIAEGGSVSVSYQFPGHTLSGLNLTVTNDVVIEAGGGINASGKGYGGGAGPGAGATVLTNYPYSFYAGSGGGHGGCGGSSSTRAAGGNAYDALATPISLGSGGGAGSGKGGAGGGAVKLVLGGRLQVDGQIAADGNPGVNPHSGGGAGGSLWLSAQTVTGSGTMTAKGGAGEPLDGGGGGGGRIAVICSTNLFVGSLAAHGGLGATGGGAGTVYSLTSAPKSGPQVLIDNAGVRGTNTPLLGANLVDLTVSGGAIVNPTVPQNFSHLLIRSNSWFTWLPSQLYSVTVGGDAVIEAGGGITADGKGYAGGTGPGASRSLTVSNTVSGGGGGYGGYGGPSAKGALSGGYYGSTTAPNQFGSGGGGGSGSQGQNQGGSGGGAILLTVAGALAVDGRMTADGSAGAAPGSGGGSGGSVYLTVGKLAGAGIISANGGAGEMPLGGGGGGGRIAVYCSTNAFTGNLLAYGGRGASNGAAGTIYFQSPRDAVPQVVVDNGGWPGFSNTVILVTGACDLTISGGASAGQSGSATYRNLLVRSNSWFTFSPSSSSYSLTVTSNAIIQAGGGIILDRLGSAAGSGSGPGRSYSTSLYGYVGGGGGHGGYGGAAVTNALGGNSYGSFSQPTAAGSGGGTGSGTSPYNQGGAGGGALRLTVNNALMLDGSISANGGAGLGQNSGGGSGGSLWLTIGTLSGGGIICANGGPGDLPNGGGGGGGRVALYCTTNQFTGTLSARGGAGANYGGAGTIWLQTPGGAGGNGQVIVDNGGVAGTNTPLGELPSLPYCDLTISGRARATPVNGGTLPKFSNLFIGANSWLSFASNVSPQRLLLTVTSNATIQAGGGILLDGAGYAAGAGTGSGGSYGGGGGYGGYGGAALTNTSFYGGNSYGSLTAPGDLGSGGGGSAMYGWGGGSGGGALQITISGALLLDGSISANGTAGRGQSTGGGSGGSVWLMAGRLAGRGTISANGGSGDLPLGGGGGGGRIALCYSTNEFTGVIAARGGAGGNYGGAGTIYCQASNSPSALVIVDNGGGRGTNTPLSRLPSSSFDLTIKGGAQAVVSGVPPSATIGSLLVGPNSWLTYGSSQSYYYYNMTLTILSNAVLQAGGGILLDGLGYPGGQGTGVGKSVYISSSVYNGGGGGHGGAGGAGAYGAAGGTSYGSLTEPVTTGSGGGGQSYSYGGSGGGALQMTVKGSFVVDGKITANGTTSATLASGGGSGGSIYLTVGALTGAGAISADGGSGDLPLGGGGGGGRIAIRYGTNLFTGTLSARGGPGAMFGGAGTIYIASTKSGNNQVPQVLVDNGGWPGGSTNTLVDFVEPNFDVTVSGGATARLPASSLRNLVVNSNSWLTLSSQGSGPRTLTVTGNATVQRGGGVTMDGLGYAAGAGQGAGRSVSGPAGYTGGGGGYGGYGGLSAYGAAGGNCYGSDLALPTELGSGGGAGFGTYPAGGSGGGALKLTVSGVLALDGKISADGAPGPGPASGGGSGGSLWLSVGKLTGAGVLSANGGAGDPLLGGGGGGGRIALYPTTNEFLGTLLTRGGAGATYGGAGTVYVAPPRAANTYPQIIVDNGGWHGTNTSLQSFRTSAPTDLTVSSGAVVETTGASGSIHNLLVTSNAWVTQLPGDQGVRLNLTGNATLQAGGGINVDGKSSAAGYGAGSGGKNYNSTGGGGGYGGYGGSSAANAPGGNAYGSLLQPSDAGSAGADGYNAGAYWPGGGIVILTVAQSLVLDGTISANGADAGTEDSGGGSGGSIWLTAGTLSGAGRITADGGWGDYPQGGGGGGGRIAIYYNASRFTGTLSAFGGDGAVCGGAGTIYSKASSQLVGQVAIDNGGWPGTNTPLTATEPFNLTVVGSAVVNPSTPALVLRSLTVDRGASLTHLNTQTNLDVTVLGDAAIGTNGTIIVDGKGYSGTKGGPGAGLMTNSYSGSGGGYGGAGGAGISGIPGGPAYGSAERPIERGSRGGLYPANPGFCEGGGALWLKVGGTLTLNGRLSANGRAALLEGAGGGAGGSIWLTARRLDGTGLILANGGPGEPDEGGGGGGGRIAIYCRTNLFAGVMAAYGGAGASWGGSGTIYITNIPAPQVILQSPNEVVSYAVSNVDLVFSSPMNFSTLATADLLLEAPYGTLPQSSLTPTTSSLTSLRVGFPPQTELGYYELWVGPAIEDIYGQPMPDAYVGGFVILPPVIAGRVIDTNGLPVRYVTLRLGGDLIPALTDSNGAYSIEVLPSWTGTITPSKGTSIFIPASRSYTNLSASLTNQDFVMAPPAALNLTQERQGANVNLRWFGINGVSYQPLYSTNLVNWWPYDGPLLGTNGPMTLAVPLGGEPVKFFRFSANY